MVETLASVLSDIKEDLICLWADYSNGKRPAQQEIESSVTTAVTLCRKIGWGDVANQGQRFLAKTKDPTVDPKELRALADDFSEAVQEKFGALRLVAVEDRDLGLFTNAAAELCGGPLHQDLAISEEEFDLAGRALALGMSTASVSHAMRSAEASLHVVGSVLGISFTVPLVLVEWSNLTQKIDTEIKGWDSKPRSQEKTAQLKRLAELLLPADGFRLAWRNHVAHAREKYEEPQARRILQHVGEYLGRVSAAL
jgi:hypothetical protein